MTSTAQLLRDQFDDTFAAPKAEPGGDRIDLLGIAIAGDPHALRLSQIAGVYTDRAITPVPNNRRALLGIIGLRGSIVPAFDLAVALGYATNAATRWVALVDRPAGTIGLAFEVLVEHLKVPANAFASRSTGTILQVVEAAGRVWPVIDLAQVCAELEGPKES